MIKRIQDLTELYENQTSTDVFELSYKLDPHRSDGYISKKLTYASLLSSCIEAVSSIVESADYQYQSLPIGTIIWRTQAIASVDLLASELLPLNGLVVTLGESLSIENELNITRPDLEDLFAQIDLMTDQSDVETYVKSGYNLGLFSSNEQLAEMSMSSFYDGYLLYNPDAKTIRLPNLSSLMMKSSSFEYESNLRIYSQLPNIVGQFANGITTDEIAERHMPLSDVYSGAIHLKSDDAIEYFEDMNSAKDTIYKKSLSKLKREADIYCIGTQSQVDVSAVYSGTDGRVHLKSISLLPFMVVKQHKTTTQGI